VWLLLEIDRHIGLVDISVQYLGFTDISVSSKTASVGVDKMLLYSSRIQTTHARKHNEPSQGSYLEATLAVAFSQANTQGEP